MIDLPVWLFVMLLVLGGAMVWLLVAIIVGMLIGKGIKLRDQQVPHVQGIKPPKGYIAAEDSTGIVRIVKDPAAK